MTSVFTPLSSHSISFHTSHLSPLLTPLSCHNTCLLSQHLSPLMTPLTTPLSSHDTSLLSHLSPLMTPLSSNDTSPDPLMTSVLAPISSLISLHISLLSRHLFLVTTAVSCCDISPLIPLSSHVTSPVTTPLFYHDISPIMTSVPDISVMTSLL